MVEVYRSDEPVPGDPDRFQLLLAARNDSFLLLSPLEQAQVGVCFQGRYQEQPVVWNARLLALQHPLNAGLQPEGGASQFMEIGSPRADGIPITIGLAVPLIDRSVVEKTIIMIRKYKRLHDGRHEFGSRLTAQSAG